MNKWFVCQNEKVTGPFSIEEVQAFIGGGKISPEALIWGKTQTAWKSAATWLKDVPTLTITTDAPGSQQMWHFAIDGVSKGPVTRIELVNELKNIQNKSEILVWTKGMKSWVDLFEFHDLLDEMGLNRREQPRAHINGAVVIKYENLSLIGKLRTVSIGGFGVAELSAPIPIGQVVNFEIKSNQLPQTITGKANIQYSSESGFWGFKFQNMNMEAKAHIMEFINNNKPDQQAA